MSSMYMDKAACRKLVKTVDYIGEHLLLNAGKVITDDNCFKFTPRREASTRPLVKVRGGLTSKPRDRPQIRDILLSCSGP